MRACFMQWGRVAILSFFAVYLYYSPAPLRGIVSFMGYVCGPCAMPCASRRVTVTREQ